MAWLILAAKLLLALLVLAPILEAPILYGLLVWSERWPWLAWKLGRFGEVPAPLSRPPTPLAGRSEAMTRPPTVRERRSRTAKRRVPPLLWALLAALVLALGAIAGLLGFALR